MVTFNFKLTERGIVNCPISRAERLDVVLQQYTAEEGIDLGGYIAVREGKVMKGKSLINDGDMIDIFPAISGG
jgi:molybdopterin converting factor small subunit